MPTELPATAAYILDQQVGFALRKAHQRHIQIFFETIGDDLTITQFSILRRLAEAQDPISQNALGRSVAMDAATTKGVVSRLVERGLVSMERDPHDRRRHNLSLTEAGRATVIRLTPLMQEVTSATLAPLTAEEAALLVALLDKIS